MTVDEDPGAGDGAGELVDERVVVQGRTAVVRRLRRPAAGVTSGNGGAPLVLVPGCGRDHRDFDRLLLALAALDVDGRVDVIVPALPGRAGVGGAPPASAGEAAAFVRAALGALGIARAVVGGHSYGGGVALELALSLVDDGEGEESRGPAGAAPPLEVVGLALLATGARLRVSPAVFTAVEASGDAVALADWRACDRFDRLRDVGRLRGPAVVVAGADDPLIPVKFARHLADAIRPSTAVVLDGAGHELPSTHAREVAAALLPLLLDG